MRMLLLLLLLPFATYAQQTGAPPGTVQPQNTAYIQGTGLDAALRLYFGSSKYFGISTTYDAPVGDIYNRKSWSDLSDFVNTGGFTASNAKINIPVGEGGTLRYNYNTALDINVLRFVFRATNGVKSATPVKFGFSSQNGAAQISNYISFVETGANAGKIALYSSADAAVSYSSGGLPAYNAGDLIELTLEQTGGPAYTITAKNLTLGTTYSYIFNLDVGGTGQAFLHNTASPAIVGTGSTASYEISAIQYSSKNLKGGNWGLGDSITYGFNAGAINDAWARKAGLKIMAGVGDRSIDLVNRLPEILLVAPKVLYLAIGTNDPDINVWKSNYAVIVATCERAGIKVVKLTPYPNNSRDMAPYANYIIATYPDSYIDIYTPLKQSGGTGLNPAYVSGTDPVHFNQAGHALVANTILASPLYSVTTPYQKLSSNILLPSAGGSNAPVVAPGSDGQVVYNSNGSLAATEKMVYNPTNAQLGVKDGPSGAGGDSRVSGIFMRNGATQEQVDLDITGQGFSLKMIVDTGVTGLHQIKPFAIDKQGRINTPNNLGQPNTLRPTNLDAASYSGASLEWWLNHGLAFRNNNGVVTGYMDTQLGYFDYLNIFMQGKLVATREWVGQNYPSTVDVNNAFMNYYNKAYIDANYMKLDGAGNMNWITRTITTGGRLLILDDNGTQWWYSHIVNGTPTQDAATLVTDGAGNRTFTITATGAVIP